MKVLEKWFAAWLNLDVDHGLEYWMRRRDIAGKEFVRGYTYRTLTFLNSKKKHTIRCKTHDADPCMKMAQPYS